MEPNVYIYPRDASRGPAALTDNNGNYSEWNQMCIYIRAVPVVDQWLRTCDANGPRFPATWTRAK